LEDNMVDGLFFCATLTDRKGGHAPSHARLCDVIVRLVRVTSN